MLPALILRMIAGSSLVSKAGASLGDLMKALMAAWRLCASSSSRRFLARRKNHIPPIAAAMTTTPTTTPAAMAATLGPELLVFLVAAGDWVTMTVWPRDDVSKSSAVRMPGRTHLRRNLSPQRGCLPWSRLVLMF